jgi:hypothetical protein
MSSNDTSGNSSPNANSIDASGNRNYSDASGNRNYSDASGNRKYSDASGNLYLTDSSGVTYCVDASGNLGTRVNVDASGYPLPPTIVNYTLNETLTDPGLVIQNQQGTTEDGSHVTKTTFHTTDGSGADIIIEENLVSVVQSYYDNSLDQTSETNILLNQIKDYAVKIQCSDFQGKGTIDDYSQLFQAASKIATDTKQIKLDVNIDGFTEFGAAADDLSALFQSFIVKLQTVTMVDDLDFLRSITAALAKIWNLSEVFGEFKRTIMATASVDIPKSSHDATLAISSVMSQVGCAMNYITNFVTPASTILDGASLSVKDQNIINKAVSTIDAWKILSDQGVSIAMNNSADVKFIQSVNGSLRSKTSVLQSATQSLRSKLTTYNIHQ